MWVSFSPGNIQFSKIDIAENTANGNFTYGGGFNKRFDNPVEVVDGPTHSELLHLHPDSPDQFAWPMSKFVSSCYRGIEYVVGECL